MIGGEDVVVEMIGQWWWTMVLESSYLANGDSNQQ